MPLSNSKKLKYIASLVKNCQKCSLFRQATNSVPGSGLSTAKIIFIGEAPGFHEDQQGLPFVGNSGKLLDKLLASIELDRKSVFIGNILKHRPPDNRNPQPGEIKVCTPYLKAQIKIINPKIIVTLGRFALNYFFPQDLIGRVRGQVRNLSWQGVDLTIIPVYHPSAGLRNGSMLSALQEDFVKIGQYISSSDPTVSLSK